MAAHPRACTPAGRAAGHVDLFALAGIATVLVTRAFLAQAGYPRLGGGGGSLHIAHMLWGGLLMAAAILLMVCFLGHAVRRAGALVGGVGFGLFIDEIGKQVTDEPGYFYQPAAGLIYASFALPLLLARLVRRRTADPARLTAERRTAHAADLALAGVTRGLTAEQRRSALALVADSERDVDTALARLLATVPERAPAKRRRARAAGAVRALRRLAGTPLAATLAVVCVVTEALLLTCWILADLAGGRLSGDPQVGASVGILLSAAVSAALGLAGLLRCGCSGWPCSLTCGRPGLQVHRQPVRGRQRTRFRPRGVVGADLRPAGAARGAKAHRYPDAPRHARPGVRVTPRCRTGGRRRRRAGR